MDYAIRFLACLLKWMVIVAVVLVLCFGSFNFAMNLSHIYVMVSDGMGMRVGVAIGYNDESELPKFFTDEAIFSDAIYQMHTYDEYDMEGYDADLQIDSFDVKPWSDTAKVVVSQTVNSVTGYLPVSKQTPEQLKDPNKIPAPPWSADASYTLTLQKSGDQWRISAIEELPLENT